MAYEAQGVNFDGTNDDLERGADLTGNADSKLFSGSLWFKIAASNNRVIAQNPGNGYEVKWTASDVLTIRGENAAGTDIFDINVGTVTDTTSWHHLMWSIDLSDTAKRHAYLDDVDSLVVALYNDDTIEFTATNHFIGQNSAGGNRYSGDLADVWLAPGQFIDLSVTANRRKFIGPNGGAVDLGSDGSTPTGTAPLMFFSGATATWHTNDGTGGGFTENGALTDAATNPPTEPGAAPPKGSLMMMGIGI